MQVNPPVFFISAALILAFVLFGALFPEQAGQVFEAAQAVITIDFGWFYVVAVAGFLFFVLFLMLSRYGDVKLGPDDSEPNYRSEERRGGKEGCRTVRSRWSW